MVPISDALKDLLDRQEMRSKAVGADELHGKKSAGGSDERAGRQLPLQTGGEPAWRNRSGLRLAWTNPAMAKTAKRGGHPAVLAMIVCKQ